jgi:hypothetical protein
MADERDQKLVLILGGMWIATFAMIAVLIIDQTIKRDIIKSALQARTDLYKLETLLGTVGNVSKIEKAKAGGFSGRDNSPAHPVASVGSGNGSGPVDRSSADMAKDATPGTGGGSPKQSTRTGKGTNGRTSSPSKGIRPANS